MYMFVEVDYVFACRLKLSICLQRKIVYISVAIDYIYIYMCICLLTFIVYMLWTHFRLHYGLQIEQIIYVLCTIC